MNKWPLQSECDSFYGNPRGKGGTYNPTWAKANLVHVPCPWALHTFNTNPKDLIPVPFITIHKKCASSLTAILNAIWLSCGKSAARIHELRYDLFSGSFNYRPKRGSNSLSMHGYGCAIDWDAPDNQFQSKKHLFTVSSPLVIEFEKEGWIWGGKWASPDAMHVQAARVR